MPYIITTRYKRLQVDLSLEEQQTWRVCPGCPACEVEPDRLAVATIYDARNEAHEAVCMAVGYDSPSDLARDENAALRLSESGGTIGPLPDGTTIEVQQIAASDLAQMGRVHYPAAFIADWSDAEIVARFNAAQATV